jgi:hypothetical protein
MRALRRSRLLRALTLLVFAGALGGAILLASTMLGESSPPTQIKEGLLSTTNRDRLALCVQAVGVDSALQAEAKSHIEKLLPQLEQHPNWALSGLEDTPPPVVDDGCPTADAALLRPGADVKGGAPGSAVAEPSPYQAFVFILPQSEIDRLFEGWPLRSVSQELLREGDVGLPVTTGIYMSIEEIRSPSFLSDTMVKGIGLENPVPE